MTGEEGGEESRVRPPLGRGAKGRDEREKVFELLEVEIELWCMTEMSQVPASREEQRQGRLEECLLSSTFDGDSPSLGRLLLNDFS